MLYNKFPKFLDDILFSFTNDFNKSKSMDELKSIVFKKELSKGYNLNTPDENLKLLYNDLFTYTEYLKYALDFLHQEKFIVYDENKRANEKSVTITSKGFFKIRTEGFARKILNDKIKTYLQISVWIVALVTFGLTIYTQFIKTNYVPSYNISTNCNCTSSLTCSNHLEVKLKK